MIWADRTGLAVAALVALCAGLFTGVVFVGVGEFGDGRLLETMALWGAIAEFAIALPFWAFLRLLDLIFGGPWRRRAHHERGDERKEPDLRDFDFAGMDETAAD